MLKKKIYVILLIMIIIIGINIDTLAFNMLPKVSIKDVEQKQVKISLEISELEEYKEGINVVSGKLLYDSNIFESISFKGINNWSSAYNGEEGNENKGKFMLITTAGNVTEDKEVAVIELILRPNVTAQNTKIKIESIQTSYHSEKIKAEDKEISLQIADNNVKIISEENNSLKTNNNLNDKEEIDYNTYILIVLISIIVITFIIFIIKMKRKERTNEG